MEWNVITDRWHRNLTHATQVGTRRFGANTPDRRNPQEICRVRFKQVFTLEKLPDRVNATGGVGLALNMTNKPRLTAAGGMIATKQEHS